MTDARPTTRRRVLGGLLRAALVAGALPLLAPTCGDGQPGVKTFSRSSLIIPMDACYQYGTDDVRSTYSAVGCPQASDPGDAIKAYGLVYQLIRNNIAVYWVISPTKASFTDVDLTIQYDPPVLRYDWATGGTGQAPTSTGKIDYRGGPFVVDGSDYAKASAILQQYRSTFGTVKVHVSNVAFRANVAKPMAGGWSAGGTVPPKLALLDIGSSGAGAKNSEVVIQGYLQKAGLDTPGAAGTATGTHGQIYDRLFMSDFLPASGSTDWRTSNLYKNGYQVLWVPHWAAPSSCSDCPPGTTCTCANKYAPATIAQALQTIGAFSAAGGDVFAECAGLGSFEGVFSGTPPSTASFNSTYQSGDRSTHFETVEPAGVWINRSVGSYTAWSGNFASPLMQLGDYPFIPQTGAIQNFKANTDTSTRYKPETIRLISDATDSTYDIFTFVPRSNAHGTVVYLGGHSYSGTDGKFEVAGSRLVLNTLFNLGAGCVASGVACNTGKLGVCGQGVMTCDSYGQQVCMQVNQPGAETCDGLDNDCNGLVDDGLDAQCYDGPPSSLDASGAPRGTCRMGVSSCQRKPDGSYGMSACSGEVLPASEICNGLDDNCDGGVDENLQQACYTGPLDTVDQTSGQPRGACAQGLQACTNGLWGACTGQVLPQPESCGSDAHGNGVDENCNGLIDESCGCNPGATLPCYGGAPGTVGVGACHRGTQTCNADRTWSFCVGEVTPKAEVCGNGIDDDCNGVVDDPSVCPACPPPGDPSLVCLVPGVARIPDPKDPGKTIPQGVCRDGVRTCSGDGLYSGCTDLITPAPEICDGLDNDCDGTVDDGASCGDGFSCVNGVCVRATCGVEMPCPEGYACTTGGTCVPAGCGDAGAVCGAGLECQYGTCTDPCAGVKCGTGAVCASGTCTGGSCYFTGCPSGQLCRSGACVADPCSGVTCPAGTFCRAGDCVQACVFQSCRAGERCSVDGFCEPDPCAGKTCASGLKCQDGACVADPCVALGCGRGQTCVNGACVDDPCSGVACPAGTCSEGQCYATESLVPPSGPPAPSGHASGGCGSGSGDASPAALLLLALTISIVRRRRAGAAAVAVLAAAGLAGSGCSSGSKAPFDPASCEETCGEQRCVDLQNDPAHCGACGRTCGSGETCVDAVCGPTALVAPYIKSASPTSLPKGGTADVALTGDRFAAAASVRTVSPYATRTYPPCDATTTTSCVKVADAGHATVSLDLTDSPTTELELRVVSADRVISNAVTLGVVTATPHVTAVTPDHGRVGVVTSVLVSGSGFASTSQCHVSSAQLPEEALPSALGAGGLTCTLDPAMLPGAYQLWVVNEGKFASPEKLTFTLDSVAPTLTAITPNAGQAGTTVSFDVAGSGFDASSQVMYRLAGSSTGTAIPGVVLYGPNELFVPQYALPACPSGGCTTPDSVYVQNGTQQSAPLPFYRGAAPAQVLSLDVRTQPLYQGDTATLVFTGTGFIAGTAIEVRPPISAPSTITQTTVSTADPAASTVTGTYSLVGKEDGVYTADLRFPGGAVSSAFQFRVLSNVAVLASVTPSGGVQGASVPTLQMTGSNFKANARVQLLAGPSSSPVVVQDVPGAWSSSAPDKLTATGLKLVDGSGVSLDTGVYALAVVNPSATRSNALSFSVSPGPPTLATVSPVSAPQQDAPVTVTLVGTNFAKPDASGSGGSTVMVAGYDQTTSPPTPLTSGFVPAPGTVTVLSSTRIQVQLDTRAGVPGTYHVAIWNPGGNPPPQRSDATATPGTFKDPLTLPSFTITAP